MFWALNLSPGKRYSQVVSKSFHLSMACLDLDNTEAEVVPVFVQWNKEKHIICNLSKNTAMQQSLDLNFQAGDEIVFYTKGKAIVHLTGYLIPEEDLPGLMSDDSEDDAEEKAAEDAKEILKVMATKSMKRGLEEKTSKNKKQKLDSSATGEEELSDEDEDDEDFALEEESSEEDSEDDGDGEKGLESDSDESEEEMESSIEEKKESPKPVTGKKAKQKESLGKPAKKDATPGKKAESVNGTPNQQSAKKKKQKDGTPQSKGTPKAGMNKQKV